MNKTKAQPTASSRFSSNKSGCREVTKIKRGEKKFFVRAGVHFSGISKFKKILSFFIDFYTKMLDSKKLHKFVQDSEEFFAKRKLFINL